MITGVCGSGKSTLVHDVLYKALTAKRNGSSIKEFCDRIEGDAEIREIVMVDQSPIGRTPRSNPATYLKASTRFAKSSPTRPTPSAAASPPAIFRSTFPAAAAKPARATAPSPSRCNFSPTLS